jgi:hypothetical protein
MPRERVYDYPPTEYSRAIARLGWNQVQASRMLGLAPRSSRRYAAGDREMDGPLSRLLRLLIALKRTDEWFLEVTKEEAKP